MGRKYTAEFIGKVITLFKGLAYACRLARFKLEPEQQVAIEPKPFIISRKFILGLIDQLIAQKGLPVRKVKRFVILNDRRRGEHHRVLFIEGIF